MLEASINNSEGLSRSEERIQSLVVRELSHNKLVKEIASNPGNQIAWMEFCRRYHTFIVETIMKILAKGKSHQLAEDIAQDVYQTLINNNCKALQGFIGKHENSIYKWLQMIAVRQTIRQLKTQPQTIPFDAENGAIESASLQSSQSQNSRLYELIEEINHCLNKILKNTRHIERDKKIFWLRFYYDKTPEEIAMRFDGLSVKRVWGVLTHLKKALQNHFEILPISLKH